MSVCQHMWRQLAYNTWLFHFRRRFAKPDSPLGGVAGSGNGGCGAAGVDADEALAAGILGTPLVPATSGSHQGAELCNARDVYTRARLPRKMLSPTKDANSLSDSSVLTRWAGHPIDSMRSSGSKTLSFAKL